MITPEQRDARDVKAHLVQLSRDVAVTLARIDALMPLPPSPEKGKKLAALMNKLDMANDAAMHFGLGLSFRKISNLKKKLR